MPDPGESLTLFDNQLEVNQHPIGRIPNDVNDGKYLCLKDMLLVGAAPEVPQGPFHHMKNPRQCRICAEDCGLFLEMLEQRNTTSTSDKEGMAHRKAKCRS